MNCRTPQRAAPRPPAQREPLLLFYASAVSVRSGIYEIPVVRNTQRIGLARTGKFFRPGQDRLAAFRSGISALPGRAAAQVPCSGPVTDQGSHQVSPSSGMAVSMKDQFLDRQITALTETG